MMEIDPIRYGALYQKVEDSERRINEINHKIDGMEKQLTELIALANKGKGGFWVGMLIVSAISSVVGYMTHAWSRS
jgi:hypothetical protein